MTGFAQVAFSNKANGSLIKRNGKVVGSRLAAQAFTSAEVLPRAAVGDRRPRTTPAATTFANLGPTNPDLAKNVGDRRDGDPEARAPVQPRA